LHLVLLLVGMYSSTLVMIDSSTRPSGSSMMRALRGLPRSGMCITRGRTVAICGR
jgi:hypothetical protein